MLKKQHRQAYRGLLATTIIPLAIALTAGSANAGKFGFGTTPTKAEIAAINIDVMADGRGLPAGSGTVAQGKAVYEAKCVACHGANLQGVKITGGAALIGGRGSIGTTKTKKTVESYWPYASTLFDYVRRAMPFNAPGSLKNDEVYAVSAYVLNRAQIIKSNEVMSAKTLAKVKMPNRNGFITDPRPDVHNYR